MEHLETKIQELEQRIRRLEDENLNLRADLAAVRVTASRTVPQQHLHSLRPTPFHSCEKFSSSPLQMNFSM